MKKFKHALNLSDLPLTKMEPVGKQHIHDEYISVEAEEVKPSFNVEIDYLEPIRKAYARIRPDKPRINIVLTPMSRYLTDAVILPGKNER